MESREPPQPPPESPRTNLQPASRAPRVVAALLILAAAGGGWYWWSRRSAPPPAPPPAPAQVAPAPAEAPPSTAPAAPVPADRLRALLESLSADARYRGWLAAGDWVRRWAVVTDNLAEGDSPRKQLPFLAPGKPFTVSEAGGKTVVAAASYRRYDGFAEAVASIDARAAAAAYRELHPLLEAAWRALGYPQGRLDEVTARALHRLEAAPVRDHAPEVVKGKGDVWHYTDAALEELGPVEKHLLRMGPRNARLVQAKARELREALSLR